ncbi:MAG: helix-turn-helix domain-containing protein [Dorea sp.]|nr:helix-turn-helix domain-containing protein [Dorea sp.]
MTQRERASEILFNMGLEMKEGEERYALLYAANMLKNMGNGGSKRKVSEATRRQISRDKLDGYQNKEIARRNRVSISTVCRIVREDGIH